MEQPIIFVLVLPPGGSMASLTQFWDSLTSGPQILKKLDELKKQGIDFMNANNAKLQAIADQQKAAAASSAESDANILADINRVLGKLTDAEVDPAIIADLQAIADAQTAAAEARKNTAAIIPEDVA